MQRRRDPSFFLANRMLAPNGDEEGIMYPLSRSSVSRSFRTCSSYWDRIPRGRQGGNLTAGSSWIRGSSGREGGSVEGSSKTEACLARSWSSIDLGMRDSTTGGAAGDLKL